MSDAIPDRFWRAGLRRQNRTIELLVLGALLLLGRPGTARGQSLTFSPSPVALTISGPGATASQVVTVTGSNSAMINSVFVSRIDTTPPLNWLSASSGAGNTFTLTASNTSSLTPGAIYNGTVTVAANGSSGITGALNVSLTIGSNSGNGGGLVASPSQVSFVETSPGQASRRPVSSARLPG